MSHTHQERGRLLHVEGALLAETEDDRDGPQVLPLEQGADVGPGTVGYGGVEPAQRLVTAAGDPFLLTVYDGRNERTTQLASVSFRLGVQQDHSLSNTSRR